MRIIKLNYKATTPGRRHTSPRYFVEFKDHHAIRRRVVAFTDKDASAEFGRTIDRLVSMRGTGLPLDAATSSWLELLSDRHRARFAEWGLIDAQVSSLSDPLTVHVESFRQHLEAKGRTAGYVRDKCSRVLAVMTGCGFVYFRDIRAEAIRAWGATKRDDGMAKRTWAHHVDAIRAFCTFMAASGRVASSPLENLKALDVDDEKPRGVLTRQQLDVLCAATPARALLYWLAFESTQRLGTLAGLTRGDLRVRREQGATSGNLTGHGQGNTGVTFTGHGKKTDYRAQSVLETAPITGGAIRTIQRKGRTAQAREHWVPLKAALAAALDDHAARMHRDAAVPHPADGRTAAQGRPDGSGLADRGRRGQPDRLPFAAPQRADVVGRERRRRTDVEAAQRTQVVADAGQVHRPPGRGRGAQAARGHRRAVAVEDDGDGWERRRQFGGAGAPIGRCRRGRRDRDGCDTGVVFGAADGRAQTIAQ